MQKGRLTIAMLVVAVMLHAGAAWCMAAPSVEEIGSLNRCAIVVSNVQPAFVRRAVDDLVDIVRDLSGRKILVLRPGEASAVLADLALIEVGLRTAREIGTEANLPVAGVAEEHVVVARTLEEPQGARRLLVEVGGVDAAGLQAGVLELIRQLRVRADEVTIEVPLAVVRRPRFTTRSMYAHLHWAYKRPYALRSWTLDDWKRYVDLLTHLGYNAIQIWPMVELMPHPLSAEDEAYLSRFAELIDYAQQQRGMKVFIGSCPNNITEDARGVPIAEREYFEFERLLDPADPDNLARILEHRSDLYRTVPNADGYWVIDSDPGGWPGSETSAFVEILLGHRRLIEKHGARPSEQPVIYWMWQGWGTGRPQHDFGRILGEFGARMQGPWLVQVCNAAHLRACEGAGVTDRAIWFPYGLVEDEPSGPFTELRLQAIADSAAYAKIHGLQAIQGNAQTPLMQLPNISALALAAWGDARTGKPGEMLAPLANRLLRERADVLISAWQALGGTDPAECLTLADEVRRLAHDRDARGTLAVILGDWHGRILDDLATMLIIRAQTLAFAHQVATGTPPEQLVDALTLYVVMTANWLANTGYHNDRILMHRSYFDPVFHGLCRLRGRLGEDAIRKRLVEPTLEAAGQHTDPQYVGYVMQTLLGERR